MHINIHLLAGDPPVREESRPDGQGSKIYALSSEPKEINLFPDG